MSKVIISLTSYPKRIHVVHKVIKSLWNQRICADKIILYLSTEEFPQKATNLPEELLKMVGINGFRIEWVEGNLKSHKKYYYALQKYCDDIVVTVDDDVEYAETLLSDLWESYKRFPNAISARRTRMIQRDDENIMTYNDWDNYYDECSQKQRMDLCAIGVGGVLYPPHCASVLWFEKDKIMELAENQDDLWLKFHEIIDEIPVLYVKPTQVDKQIAGIEETALSLGNICNKENDICIKKMCKYMRMSYPSIYNDWIEKLMTKEEFVLEKKNYYFSYLQKVFNDMKDAPIYLYGAGEKAQVIVRILSDAQVLSELDTIIVSDRQNNPNELQGIKVKKIDEVDKCCFFNVILGVGAAYKLEVKEVLKDYQCKCFELELQGLLRDYKI